MEKEIKKYYQRYQVVILPSGASFIALVLIALLIVPSLFTYSKNAKQQTEIEQKTKLLSSKATQLQAINVTALKTDLNNTIKVLPPEKEVTAAINQVQILASANTIQILSLEYSSIGGIDKSDNFTIRMEVVGPLTSMRNFGDSLRESARVMKIKDIEINGLRGGVNYSATLTISVYYQAVPSLIGEVDAPFVPLSQSDQELLAKINNALEKFGSVNAPSEDFTGTGPVGKPDPFQ